MSIIRLLSSEWLRYKHSRFLYIYIIILLFNPFLIKGLNLDGPDETMIMAIIALIITVLAATEIPRLNESGILKTVLLSNISRECFYISQMIKYIIIYCLSFFIGILSLLIIFKAQVNFEWIIYRFFIYFISILFYISLAQLLSIIFRKTVEALMTSLLILFVIIPIFNSFYFKNVIYTKLPFLYIEPKNLFTLKALEIIYPTFLMLGCSLVIFYIGLKKMLKTEV